MWELESSFEPVATCGAAFVGREGERAPDVLNSVTSSVNVHGFCSWCGFGFVCWFIL